MGAAQQHVRRMRMQDFDSIHALIITFIVIMDISSIIVISIIITRLSVLLSFIVLLLVVLLLKGGAMDLCQKLQEELSPSWECACVGSVRASLRASSVRCAYGSAQTNQNVKQTQKHAVLVRINTVCMHTLRIN